MQKPDVSLQRGSVKERQKAQIWTVNADAYVKPSRTCVRWLNGDEWVRSGCFCTFGGVKNHLNCFRKLSRHLEMKSSYRVDAYGSVWEEKDELLWTNSTSFWYKNAIIGPFSPLKEEIWFKWLNTEFTQKWKSASFSFVRLPQHTWERLKCHLWVN